MPVHRRKDSKGPYYQWGDSGKKYRYQAGHERSRNAAKEKAEKQGRAARARGYGRGGSMGRAATRREITPLRCRLQAGEADLPLASGVLPVWRAIFPIAIRSETRHPHGRVVVERGDQTDRPAPSTRIPAKKIGAATSNKRTSRKRPISRGRDSDGVDVRTVR